MAKKTVLEYVQSALSIMDSDEVDTISETVESVQVAEQVKETYYELLNRQEWPFLHRPIQLSGAGLPDLPTRVEVPAGLKRLTTLRYDVGTEGIYSAKEIHYVTPDEFLRRNSLPGDDKQLCIVPELRLQFYVTTNKMPTYYTSFDDEVVYMDAVDLEVEASLQTHKISATGYAIPSFVVQDDFVPLLPEEMIPLLQAAVNNACMIYFKQQPSSIDTARELRQLAQARRLQNKFTKREYYVNRYGRK